MSDLVVVISFTPLLLVTENFSPKSMKFEVALNPYSLGSWRFRSANLTGLSYRFYLNCTALLLGLQEGCVFLEYTGG